MATQERQLDRGTWTGRLGLVRLGAEIRDARRDRGLSIDSVALAVHLSNAEVSRIERGLAPNVPFINIARLAAIVGLDLSARVYPGASPIRDAAQIALLAAFRLSLRRGLRWAAEVPLPIPGDQRAWDATVTGADWVYGVEAETAPRDAQALLRRLALKDRDGGLDVVLLVIPDSRRTRHFLREAAGEINARFPIASDRALAQLRLGLSPGGSAVVMVRRRHAASR